MSAQVKKRIDWKTVDGASEFPRRLHLEKATNQRYYCPVSFCDHEGFGSQRGCRKHVKTKHGWFLYFDSKPDIREIEEKHSSVWTTVKVDGRSSTQELPTFPKTLPLAVNFLNWLQSTEGGGKTKQHSEQVLSRVTWSKIS